MNGLARLLIVVWLFASGSLLFAQSNSQNPTLRKENQPRVNQDESDFIEQGLTVTWSQMFDQRIKVAKENDGVRVEILDVAKEKSFRHYDRLCGIEYGRARLLAENSGRMAKPRSCEMREKALKDLSQFRERLLGELARFDIVADKPAANVLPIVVWLNVDALEFLKQNYLKKVRVMLAYSQDKPIRPITREQRDARIDELIKKAEVKGAISVIVIFKGVETTSDEAIRASERIIKELAEKYDAEIKFTPADDIGMKPIYKYLAMTVGADALRYMKKQDFIESVGENGIGRTANRRAQ